MHGEDFVQRSTDLAINGISDDCGHRNVNLWKCRPQPDRALTHSVALSHCVAIAKSGARAFAGSGTRTITESRAIWRRPSGDDFAEPGPLE